MKSREIFATRLKEVRLQAEKSQKEFADMIHSTAATISAYENATKNPSLEIVMNIAKKGTVKNRLENNLVQHCGEENSPSCAQPDPFRTRCTMTI